MDTEITEAEARTTRGRNGERGLPGPLPGDTSQERGEPGGVLGKPSLSYIAMIAQVILASPARKLNLAAIYANIQTQFPYYRGRGQGWKNSVRHNLSLNDCFVKLGRCEDGKGSYWGIHAAHLGGFLRGDFRQHRKASRSRRRRGAPGGDGAGDAPCWGVRPYPGPCPQCPLQLRWVPRAIPPPPLGPVSWSPGAPGDAGRWGCGWFPWRPPGWGAGEAALGGAEALCCPPCVSTPRTPNLCPWQWAPPGLRDVSYPWTYIRGDPACSYPV